MICQTCRSDLSNEKFSVKYKRGGILHKHCKQCRAATTREERAHNPEKIRAREKRGYWKDPAKARSASVVWRKNRTARQVEMGRQRGREWKARNPDAWKNHDMEKARIRGRKWEAQHPELRALIQQNRMARERGGVGFTQRQLEARLSYFAYCCWICGEQTREMDHVIPLAAGGKHAPSNIRPCCRTCNAVKSSNIIHNQPKLLASILARSQELKIQQAQRQLRAR